MGKVQLIGLILGIVSIRSSFCMNSSQSSQGSAQESSRSLILKKARWGTKTTIYTGLCLGSAILFVVSIYDFATNNTPETPLSIRFAAIGTGILGIKQFGWGAYEAVCKIIAEHPDDLEESLYQRIITRLSNTNISQVARLNTPPNQSFSSLSTLASTRLQQSSGSFDSITKTNEFDDILETLGKAPESLKTSVQ